MPYRIKDTTVQVELANGWKPLKVHKNRSAALAHLKALKMNVGNASHRRKARKGYR